MAGALGDRERRARRLTDQPLVRAGVISWSVLGVGLIVIAIALVLRQLTVVVVPLVLALFPAAVLVPPTAALRRRGVPAGLAALIAMVLGIGLLVGLFTVLTPVVAGELG